MGRQELETLGLGPVAVTAAQQRAAALHIADRIAAEHPHPLDEEMPALAGQLIARNADVRQKLHDLIDALGLRVGLAEIAALQDREVGLEAELITAIADTQRLKEQQ